MFIVILFITVILIAVFTPDRSRAIETDLQKVDFMNGQEFEKWCASLLLKLEYRNIRLTKNSGDQGVDITAEKDGVRYAFQCKRYSRSVGNKPVQEVYAGKNLYNCNFGVVITNSRYTAGAIDLANATGVELWDRDTLKRLINTAKIYENRKTRKVKNENKKSQKLPRNKSKLWPWNRESAQIDVDYYKSLPHVLNDNSSEEHKEYIECFPHGDIYSPYDVIPDTIISIVSEPFQSEEQAKHFSLAIEKHCCSIVEIKMNEDATYYVLIFSHAFSISSNFNAETGSYTFANWA